jgi:hypothetical protein
MVYPDTLFHRRQRGIPIHSYENRSQIRALISSHRGAPVACAQPHSAHAAALTAASSPCGSAIELSMISQHCSSRGTAAGSDAVHEAWWKHRTDAGRSNTTQSCTV